MTANLGAPDLLRMAIQIEQNGQAFYRAAAEAMPVDGTRRLLNALAQWEGCHCETFSRLREALVGGGVEISLTNPDDALAAFFRTLARDFPFLFDEHAATPSMTTQDPPDVLRFALEMERATVVFYTGLRTLASGADSRQIDQVIQEEIRHAAMLSKSSGDA